MNGVVAVSPLAIVAVTITVPAAVALSVLPEIVAPVVPASFTLHIIAWFEASAGVTVPVSASGVPAVAADGTPVISVTATYPAVTVMVKSCVYGVVAVLPFTTVALITAVPADVALKKYASIIPDPEVVELMTAPVPPALSTFHVTVLFVAVPGATVHVSGNGVPAIVPVGTPVMSVTATKFLATVRVAVFDKTLPAVLYTLQRKVYVTPAHVAEEVSGIDSVAVVLPGPDVFFHVPLSIYSH